MRIYLPLILALALCSAVGAADKNPAKVAKAAVAAPAAASVPTVAPTPDDSDLVQVDYVERLQGHLHNKLVHFPIGLAMIGILFTLLSYHWETYFKSVRIIFVLAAVAGIWTCFTGVAQSEQFQDTPFRHVTLVHELLGIMTTGMLAGMDMTEDFARITCPTLVIAGRHHDPPDGSALDLRTLVHLACRMAEYSAPPW